MTHPLRAAVAVLIPAALIVSACGSVSGGPKKIIFNEPICANQAVIRMTVGETRRLVLDNKVFSQGQNGMTVRMIDVPLVIKGDIPPNTVVGDPLSSIVFSAAPDTETRVDAVPTQAGTFDIQCGSIVGGRSEVWDMTLQILPKK